MDVSTDAERPASFARAAVAALAAALGFGLIALAGLRLTPWPEDFPVTVKLPYLEEHAAEYNAVFIGSSEVFRSFVPNTIDEQLAQEGLDFNSFNLAAQGITDISMTRECTMPTASRMPRPVPMANPSSVALSVTCA